MKQREPLMGVELKSDKHTPITSQTPYQMPHAAFNTYFELYHKPAKCDGRAFQSTDMHATCIVN